MRNKFWVLYFILGLFLTYLAASGFAISAVSVECATEKCLFDQGSKFIDEGQYADALKSLTKGCQLNHHKSCYLLGHINKKNKNFQLAEVAYAKACSLDLAVACSESKKMQSLLDDKIIISNAKSMGFYKALSMSSFILCILLIISVLSYQFIFKKIIEKEHKKKIKDEIKNIISFFEEAGDNSMTNRDYHDLFNASEDEISKKLFTRAHESVIQKNQSIESKKAMKLKLKLVKSDAPL